MRMAFIYGSCGTLMSYLSMKYDGKVLVFKWSVPSPERFIFSSFCWSMAGMATWTLFWSRPDVLARVASSRIFYGSMHGTQTSILALALSFNIIGFWSFYFDVKEWQMDYGEWQNELMAQSASGSDKAMMTDTSKFIEEESNGESEHEQNSSASPKTYTKPVLTYQHIASNMYEPCRQFFMCNAPIWVVCGSVTGMIAARMVTQSMLLNPVTASALVATSLIEQSEDNFELLE